MNHAQRVKEQDATTRARILGFLGEEEKWLSELISEVGNDMLEKLFGTTRARENAAYSEEFWQWFNNQWNITDNELSPQLRVDKDGVMHHTPREGYTAFIHGYDEFKFFYHVRHRIQINKMQVPAELAARWVVTGKASK
ncbi:MAG TPA: hypothetical protein VF598_01955 [Hymenobacter sp.]|jgi:hypothetical protein